MAAGWMVIKSFGNKTAKDLASGNASSRHARKLPNVHHQRAMDLLELMAASVSVEDFRSPPSNRLHKLAGDLAGYWSVTIRDGWRITFKFADGHYHDVAIVDYH